MKKFCLFLLPCMVAAWALSAQDTSAVSADAPAVAVTDTSAAASAGEQPGVKVLKGEEIDKYRRSSLYTVLIRHSNAKYGNTIDSVFMMMQTPDKFNNHDLEIKSFESSARKARKVRNEVRGTERDPNISDIERFIAETGAANGMVAKWFDRDPVTGAFDIDLVMERGYYDASYADIEEAEANIRGRAMLADAGFDLIGKTFMLVNDITFVDRGETSSKVGAGLKVGLSLIGQALSLAKDDESYEVIGDASGTLAGAVANEFAGYRVNIISYLYRLDWDNAMLDKFLADYWFDSSAPDAVKRAAFDASELFTLSYVGCTMTSAANISSKSFSARPLHEQFLRVCTRALDKAIVELQREYDEFKVNVPIYSVNGDGTVDVKIGLKEGVNSRSVYEVLMKDISSGVAEYRRVGLLRAVPGRIWDNRFGAMDEARMLEQEKAAADSTADNAAGQPEDDVVEEGNAFLSATTFQIMSGANEIVPGLLIREMKIDREKQ